MKQKPSVVRCPHPMMDRPGGVKCAICGAKLQVDLFHGTNFPETKLPRKVFDARVAKLERQVAKKWSKRSV